MERMIIHTDGGARGNPGPAALGVVINDERGALLLEHSRYLGEATNNQAEYWAVIDALEQAKRLGGDELEVYLDSELVVKQLNREYRVRNPDLAPLFIKVWNLSTVFRRVRFTHVRRENNVEADRLVNQVLDALNRPK